MQSKILKFITKKIKEANTDDWVYISQDEMKKELRLSHQIVRQTIKELKNTGMILVDDYNLLFGYKLPCVLKDKK